MSTLNHRGQLHSGHRLPLAVLLTAIFAHLVLFLDLPLWLQSLAALFLTGWLPAILLLTLLLPPPNRDLINLGERALYTIGTGYGVGVLGMLGLSYLPGPIARWSVFVVFGLLLVILLIVVSQRNLRRSALPTVPPSTVPPSTAPPITVSPITPPIAKPIWFIIGLLTVVIVGGLLRFPGLGYAEFQGDEARAMLRAAEVIEGFEGSLFEHRKGPTEILLPAIPYVLIGRIDEAAARLPFAIANFCGLFALFLLGWRWFGPLAGWVAAMLLALDGYLIAFSRIVQYQSIVFLMVVLVLLILQRLVLDAERPCPAGTGVPTQSVGMRFLVLASFLLATGLLSHYEAILAVMPALLLLWQLWRNGVGLGRLVVASIPALLVGGAMLAAFYVPFVRYPTFGNTFEYLAYKRIGEEFAYNNLGDYFIRSTLYSSTYAFGLMTLLAVVGLLIRYRHGWGRVGRGLGALVLAGVIATFWSPTWLTIAGQDVTWVFFVAALGLAVLMPDRQSGECQSGERQPGECLPGERLVWLWFGTVMILSIFFTATPNTHVYNFYFGWALVSGVTIAHFWNWIELHRLTLLRWAMVPVALALILLFGYYQYSLFIRNDVEVLRTWPENHPQGYWTAYTMPISSSIFGFPHRNGWKTVSVLADEGVIDGAFDTNTKDWIVDWYTRGLGSCPRDHRYFVLADKVEPTEAATRAERLTQLEASHELLAVVDVHGQERLRIYERIPAGGVLALPEVLYLDSDEQAVIFDRTLSQPLLAQSGRVVNPTMERPLQFRLGDSIEIIGYTLHNQQVTPGGEVLITLYWRALTPIPERYTAFVQLINTEDARKAGQRDGEPVCGKHLTVDWHPGEIVADRYSVPIDPKTPFGTYGLLVGMYPTEPVDGNSENLTFYNSEGQPLGGSLSIDEIYVQPSTEQQVGLRQDSRP